VTLSYAQSLDGSIASFRGQKSLLSCRESRILTHRLRSAHDAVLVGIETVIADDPLLTVRLVKGGNPVPVVLDSNLRLPLSANLLKNEQSPFIAATINACRERQAILERLGAKVVRTTPDERGRVNLRSLLYQLWNSGVKSLMVEGGAGVITSFLSQRLVDHLVITVAPCFLGGFNAIENTWISGYQSCRRVDLPELKNVRYEQVGNDIVVWATLSREL
jgi:GTP cyclohydrolase II